MKYKYGVTMYGDYLNKDNLQSVALVSWPFYYEFTWKIVLCTRWHQELQKNV